MKKLLCIVLAIALAAALMSPALALTDEVPDGWIGIYTPEDLDAIREDLDANYILMNNIDMGAWGDWMPIGGTTVYPEHMSFTGTLDGNGYEIQNLRAVTKDVFDIQASGLFCILEDGAVVKNLGLVDAYVQAVQYGYYGGAAAGGISGIHMGDGIEISNCYVQGTIELQAEFELVDLAAAGGLLGYGPATNLTIQNCYSIVTIINDLGVTFGTPRLSNGIIAMLFCEDESPLIKNCYSNVEPFGNLYDGTIVTSPEGSGTLVPSAMPATGDILTLDEMTHAASFAGFDWTTPIWYIKEGESYPKLRPFPAEPEPPTDFTDTGTGVEAEADEGVFKPGTVMEVTEENAGNFVLGPGNSVHAVYDIKFILDNRVVQPDGKVTVRLPFKDVNPGTSANWKVYYVERNAQGSITTKIDMNATVVQIGGVYYWEFETDHFSLYAVVEVDGEIVLPPVPGIFGTNPRWTGEWWHYVLFFVGFGFIWMWF